MRNSGDLRGDRRHDERGYEGKAAAGDVAADGFDRGNALTDLDARFGLGGPRAGKLLFGYLADVLRSSPDGLQEIRTHLCFGRADFFSRNPVSSSREVYIIQFLAPGNESGI